MRMSEGVFDCGDVLLQRGGTLKGARIGVLRQLFVGVTGEREASDNMANVLKELAAA